jgi:hypothetical protein
MVLIISVLIIYQAISSINSLRTFLFIFLLRKLFVNALLI